MHGSIASNTQRTTILQPTSQLTIPRHQPLQDAPVAFGKTGSVIIDGPGCRSSLAPAVDVSDAFAAFIRLKTGTSLVLTLGDPSTALHHPNESRVCRAAICTLRIAWPITVLLSLTASDCGTGSHRERP